MPHIKLELKPFQVPNFVIPILPPGKREDGPRIDTTSFSLSEVDDSTLAQMCDEFRAAVFKKAGKVDPGDLIEL